MALVKALVLLQLKGLVRSGHLRKTTLVVMVIMAAAYTLRLISLQTAFDEYGSPLMGKSLFQEMSILQAFLITFVLIWFYPQEHVNSIKGYTIGFPLPELTLRKTILASTISALIFTGITVSLTLPFFITAFLLGGVDIEGAARVCLYFMVLGLITISLKNFWYGLRSSEILASALSFLTILVFTAIKIQADLLTPGGSESIMFHLSIMFSPRPTFIRDSISLIPWSAILGKLLISVFLFSVKRSSNPRQDL